MQIKYSVSPITTCQTKSRGQALSGTDAAAASGANVVNLGVLNVSVSAVHVGANVGGANVGGWKAAVGPGRQALG